MERTNETPCAARFRDLAITESGNEVLVYDQLTHHLHHLNPLAAFTWRNLDGKRTVADLAVLAASAIDPSVTSASIELALAQLEQAHLLESPGSVQRRGLSTTRRRFLRKSAQAAGVALPIIVSISAPTASQSSSQCGGFRQPCCSVSPLCVNPYQCRAGFCQAPCASTGSRCGADFECCSGSCGRNTGICA